MFHFLELFVLAFILYIYIYIYITLRQNFQRWKISLTCAGTATASLAGIFLGSRMRESWYKTDPENTVAKKMFHIVNQSTLLHALFSISLWETYPWIDESNSIIGGTAFRNNWRIRLGRYPVTTSLTNVLPKKNHKISTLSPID